MCIGFLFINPDPNGKFKVVIMDLRDEFFDRSTGELDWRDGILGGIDEKDPARGTWMGVDKYGRCGILLSITQPLHTKSSTATSRGAIAKSFLMSNASARDFVDTLQETATEYNGFHFLALERNEKEQFELHSLTNLLVEKIERNHWPAGVYVFGNSPPHIPFKKVSYGQERFEKLVEELKDNGSAEDWIHGLLDIGHDETNFAPDHQIAQQTGRPDQYNKSLCSIFVKFPPEIRYGTRSHSIYLVDKDNNATFYEKRMVDAPEDISTAKWEDKTVTFHLVDFHNKL